MKNKYLVISKEGKEFEPEEFIASKECSKNFRIFVEKEVLNAVPNDKNRKPEYLKIAHKLGFNWEPNADVGFMQFDYKAWFIMKLLFEYARQLVDNIGFPIHEVRGSNVFDKSYPVVEAYAKLYGDRLFQFESGKKQVVMSYDASYPQFNLASKYRLNHKDLPFAHFSLSDCYRHEQSGECMLFYRNRRFFMPDLHPYFKNVEEAFKWYPKIEEQIVKAAEAVNSKYHLISEVSSQEAWKEYKDQIKYIAKRNKRNMLVEIHVDKKPRYWIINNDYKIIDKLGQSREIACIQIDMGNAKRLGIKYLNSKHKFQHPAIIHSAVPGGIERYLYMILDDYQKRFPIWLYPVQIRLIPVSDKHISHCDKIVSKNQQVRIDIDDNNESVSKRIKRAKEALVPHSFVIGKKEIESKGDASELEQCLKKVKMANESKIFSKYNWPVHVSKQIF
jgi:threonyl-tRNA synthetase